MSNFRKRKDTLQEDVVQSKKAKPNGHWAAGLLNTMEDPKYLVQSDEKVAVVKDKYPKAEYHYLVLPKENISSLKAVNHTHLELLKHMHEIGENLAKNDKHNGKNFYLGYHAQASMLRLHLHVISDDMNSSCVKTKKHWNSFTSAFFLDSNAVCHSLESEGKVKLLSNEACKKLLNLPLKCHKCDYVPKNMPDLKKHILKHII